MSSTRQAFPSVPGVRRGCGFRQQGGVYFEHGLSPFGVPLEHYILDLPHKFETDTNVGVQIWQDPESGVYHVIDYIGATFYPEAADFIEEGRAYGFSRRAPSDFPFELLTADSRMLCLHKRGRLVNTEDFADVVPDELHRRLCARHKRATMHKNPSAVRNPDSHVKNRDLPCNAYHYIAIKPTLAAVYSETGGLLGHRSWDEPVSPFEITNYFRDKEPRHITFRRNHGSVEYQVFPAPNLERPDEHWIYPQWESALIVSLPITNISVIRATDGSHEATYWRVRGKANGQMNVNLADA